MLLFTQYITIRGSLQSEVSRV